MFFFVDLMFMNCKMDCVGYDWLRKIWPQYMEVILIDFGKEMPCKYISCSFERADLLWIKVVGLLNGANWIRISSVKTNFWSGLWKMQTIPRHISCEILQLIVRPSRERCWQVNIHIPSPLCVVNAMNVIWQFIKLFIPIFKHMCSLHDLSNSALSYSTQHLWGIH